MFLYLQYTIENMAIVVTDIDLVLGDPLIDLKRNLLYTAITRSTDSVRLLVSETSKEYLTTTLN